MMLPPEVEELVWKYVHCFHIREVNRGVRSYSPRADSMWRRAIFDNGLRLANPEDCIISTFWYDGPKCCFVKNVISVSFRSTMPAKCTAFMPEIYYCRCPQRRTLRFACFWRQNEYNWKVQQRPALDTPMYSCKFNTQ